MGTVGVQGTRQSKASKLKAKSCLDSISPGPATVGSNQVDGKI